MIKKMEFGCKNCKRKETTGEYSGMTSYTLIFTMYKVNHLINKKEFVFLDMDTKSEDMIALCSDFSEYFTNT